MNRTEEIIDQALTLRTIAPSLTIWEITKLFKAARTIHRCDENECNGFEDFKGDWDEKASLRNERRGEKAFKYFCDTLNLTLKAGERMFDVEHQGDPRGAPLIIRRHGREYRIWG
jgi:hypothetical protein